MTHDYEYDVFISYRHYDPVLAWMKRHFYPAFSGRLVDCVPVEHTPRIFIDWQIETGSAWPAALKQALRVSRYCLCILSPHYFRSAWCLAEWRTMIERQRVLRMGTDENPRGLIYGLTYFDGEHFPEEVKNIQLKDFKSWNSPYPSFAESREALAFDQAVQELCTELGNAIPLAPPWESSWPVLEPPSISRPNFELPRPS